MDFGLLIIFVVISLLFLPKMQKNKKYFIGYIISLILIICILQPALLFLLIPVSLFIFPQFLKKKKWLALYGLLLGILIIYAYYDHQYDMSQPNYNDSFGDGLADMFLWSSFIMLEKGIITRLITLYLERKKYPLKIRWGATFLGFVSVFLVAFIIWLSLKINRRSPPTSEIF